MITLYDLTFDEDRRPSPYCWRAKLAMKHKGLSWRDEPCGFTEKQKIAFAQSTTYPVIHDGTKVVKDSWAIAQHLEQAYPDKPLFPGDPERNYARFVNGWADTAIHPIIFPMVVANMVEKVRPADRPYTIESRSQRIGTRDFAAFQEKARATGLAGLRAALEPVRRVLREQEFLAGEAPAYPDYILYGTLLWPGTISPELELLEKDDPVHAWRARMDEKQRRG
jgi:glutathione S-transferase